MSHQEVGGSFNIENSLVFSDVFLLVGGLNPSEKYKQKLDHFPK